MSSVKYFSPFSYTILTSSDLLIASGSYDVNINTGNPSLLDKKRLIISVPSYLMSLACSENSKSETTAST